MVLADTKAQTDTAEGRQARRNMSELVRSQGPSAVAEQMLPKLLGETSKRERSWLAEQVRHLIEANPANGMDAAIHAMLDRADSRPDLPRISTPTLVIVGEEDQLTPLADSELLQREIRRSQLVILPGAGHLSNLEVPDDFSEALLNFLLSNI
jgi:pimeloyl-ACP methyl ester carboxylesterase